MAIGIYEKLASEKVTDTTLFTVFSEKMQSGRGQFMTNSSNGCRKYMLIFASLSVYLTLTSFSHCCFREKEMQIFIVLLFS